MLAGNRSYSSRPTTPDGEERPEEVAGQGGVGLLWLPTAHDITPPRSVNGPIVDWCGAKQGVEPDASRSPRSRCGDAAIES
jgi:hypothetical protein